MLFILFLCIFELTIAQTEQAWVFFKDKTNSNFLLKNPIKFISQKAIDRKLRHNISIDFRDLPVSEKNVNFLKQQHGIKVLSTSKWFNAAYVEGSYSTINKLPQSHSNFISSVFYMNRSLNTIRKVSKKSLNFITQQITKKSEVIIPKFTATKTSSQINQIQLQTLHNQNLTGKGLTIAVMDGGFKNVDRIPAFDRARINGQILGGYDFKDRTNDIYAYKGNAHGTNVLSVMLGYIKNEYIGTAPDANYYLFRTEIVEEETPLEEALWIEAAEKADSLGVDILNTSLGYAKFDDPKYNYTPSDMDGKTTFISQATNIALEKGMLPVVAAGNSGNSEWHTVLAPADAKGLTVGAVTNTGIKAGFSSWGITTDNRIKPDVAALGQSTSVIRYTGSVATSNGTSFSTPLITGAIACLWQNNPNLTAPEIIKIVKASAGYNHNNLNNSLGAGIPNFSKTINTNENVLVEESFKVSLYKKLQLSQNPVNQFLEFENSISSQTSNYEIFNSFGQIIKKGNFITKNKIDISDLSTGVYFFKKNASLPIRFVKK